MKDFLPPGASYDEESGNKQIHRIMKLTTGALLFCSCLAFAGNVHSQNSKVSINRNQVQLKEVLDDIESQTEYLFVSNRDIDLSTRVSVRAKNEPVSKVLNELLKDTGLTYAQEGVNIILSRTEAKAEAPRQSDNKRTINGKVTDENGEAVIGANIKEKGTANGTISDMDGRFTLAVPSGATLVISYIGYRSQEVKPDGRSEYHITLEEDSETLDEVVVVGYGTVKKKDLTGAVGAIKGKDIASRRTTQLSTALQGATAGLMVTRDNNAPGATASIKVRGVTTIGESGPLVIVDGVPGDINQISPDDVESMSVLKDAASASIYGSRAAAGVIVITTKRAKENDLSLGYNFEYGWEMPTVMPKNVGAQRFLEMVNETRYNDNPSGGWYQAYSEEQVKHWVEYNKTDPDKYPITDWNDLIFKSSAPRQTHSVDIAGGSKVVRTKASFRYDKTDGIYVNKGYERYMIRVNNDIQINKWIEAHLDVNFKRSKSTDPQKNPLDGEMRMLPPIYAVRWTSGQWGDVKDGGNILAQMTDGGQQTAWYNRVGGKAGIDISPIEGLKLSAVIAPNYNFNKSKSFVKQVPIIYADGTMNGYQTGFATTKLSESRNDNYDVTTQFFANYAKSFGKHSLTAMVGYEDYYAFWENLGASRDQYELKNFPYLDLGPLTYRDNSGNAQEYAYRSFFGRLTYNYADRYLLQVNFRRDGSSRFAPEDRWGNFPSFSAGWVVSEEKFIKDLHWDWLSFFKLRGSWGALGNERISSYYPYQAALGFGSTLFYDRNTVASLTTAGQQYYAVRDISWEKTETWDIGVDMNFLNNRLYFTGDFYKKKTKDMLLALDIPKFIGYDNPSVNAGRMHTTGYDIELGWRDNVGEFTYSVSANLSDFVSRMGDLGGTEFLGEKVKMQGSQFDEWYGYVSDGIYQTQEEVDNSAKLNNNVKVGDIRYKDISGPDGVPDGKISSEYDRVWLGGSLPRYMFGVNLSGAYKGFDLSMMFQGVGSQHARITRRMVEGLMNNWCGFPQLLEGKYWSELNTAEQNAAAEYPRLTRNNAEGNYTMSDYWMFNGRYLRMKNITLGYTVPSEITKKVSIRSLRFYVSANDLFCLNNYPKGWDPEVSETGYPITTSLLLGVSINF